MKGLYWILVDVKSQLERLRKETNRLLKFHSTLAYNRLSTITSNLKEALSFADVDLTERPTFDELRSYVGDFAIEVLNDLERFVDRIVNDRKRRGMFDLSSHITSYLTKLDTQLNVLIGFLKFYIKILSNVKDPKLQALRFSLQTVVKDLMVIQRRHKQVAHITNLSP